MKRRFRVTVTSIEVVERRQYVYLYGPNEETVQAEMMRAKQGDLTSPFFDATPREVAGGPVATLNPLAWTIEETP